MFEIHAVIRVTDKETGLRIDREYSHHSHGKEGDRSRYRAFHTQVIDEMVEELTIASWAKQYTAKQVKNYMEKRHGNG